MILHDDKWRKNSLPQTLWIFCGETFNAHKQSIHDKIGGYITIMQIRLIVAYQRKALYQIESETILRRRRVAEKCNQVRATWIYHHGYTFPKPTLHPSEEVELPENGSFLNNACVFSELLPKRSILNEKYGHIHTTALKSRVNSKSTLSVARNLLQCSAKLLSREQFSSPHIIWPTPERIFAYKVLRCNAHFPKLQCKRTRNQFKTDEI